MHTLHFDGFRLAGVIMAVDIYPSTHKDKWKKINVPRVYVNSAEVDAVARLLSLDNETVVVSVGHLIKAVYTNGELHELNDLVWAFSSNEEYNQSKILIGPEWK